MQIATPSQSTRRTSRVGAHWKSQTVGKILENQTYAGLWRYGKQSDAPDEAVEIAVPALVSAGDYEAAQRRRADYNARHQRSTKYEYLLARRLRCGTCNRVLYGNSQRQNGVTYLYYSCRDENNVKCHGQSVNAARADRAVWEWIKRLFSDPAALLSGLDQYQSGRAERIAPLRDQLALVDDLIADSKAKLARVVDLYIAGEVDRDLLDEHKSRLDRAISELESQRTDLRDRLAQVAFTDEQRVMLEDFAREVAARLAGADGNFARRRQLVEVLNVTGVLESRGGEKTLRAQCRVSAESLVITKTATSGRGLDPKVVFDGDLIVAGKASYTG